MLLRGRLGWGACYVAVVALIATLTYVVWSFYEREARVAALEQQRAEVQSELASIARAFETTFVRHSSSIDALAAMVSLRPDISTAEFEAYSRRTFLRSPEFRLVALAPDLVISQVFPAEGNQAAIGLDYTANEAQLDAVNQAIDAGNVVIAGPVDLVQGGRALIARRAVEVVDKGAFDSRLWGIVSLVLDLDEVLKVAGATETSLNLAIRGKDGLGASGGKITGQPSVFAQDPERVRVDLPHGHWVMAAVPEMGWGIAASAYWSVRVGFALSGLALAFVITCIMRLVQLRMRADAQLSSAINSIDDGFAYYDSDDRLVLCNDKYKALYAVSAEAMVPRAKFEDIIRFGLVHGQYAEAVGREEEFLQERLEAHRKGGVDIEQKLEDGRWLKIRESKSPEGGTIGFRVDITELKNARDAAETANRAKSEFLDVMSHELRTPLTVVLGGTPFLCKPEMLPAATKLFNSLEARGEDAEALTAEVNQLLGALKTLAGKVDRSAKHLLTLINDVLDYSKIEAGRMDIALEPLSLGDVVEGITQEFAARASAKSLHLTNEITDDDEIFVDADSRRLRQVLINIVGNAIKFTETGGVSISAQDHGAKVIVTVQDTGCGIPKEQLDEVFQKFSQVDSSTTRRVGGTGLGMAISKKIIEMHGGDISVESEVGEGSTFRFTLMRADVALISADDDPELAEAG
ncbi:MAG: PAS-domain containing protein [Cognatishimia sp.]|uniref:ATP-binding protein n=1 Tax=Cognatishimia sp. TaxID=2211648 RepID=UPI003B8B235B